MGTLRDGEKSASRRPRTRSRSRAAAQARQVPQKVDDLAVTLSCAICLDSMVVGPAPELVRPYECNHRIHLSCAKDILQWRSGQRCPLCRAATLRASACGHDVWEESSSASDTDEESTQPGEASGGHDSETDSEEESDETDANVSTVTNSGQAEHRLGSMCSLLEQLGCSKGDFVNQLLQAVFQEKPHRSETMSLLDVLEAVNSLLLLTGMEPWTQAVLLQELREIQVANSDFATCTLSGCQNLGGQDVLTVRTRDGTLTTVTLDRAAQLEG